LIVADADGAWAEGSEADGAFEMDASGTSLPTTNLGRMS